MVRLFILKPSAVGLLGLRNFELPAVGLPGLHSNQRKREDPKRRNSIVETKVEEREENAESTGRGYDRTHSDPDESLHTCNAEEGRGIAGASGRSPGYGLRGIAHQTLEPPNRIYPPRIQLLEKESVVKD